MFTGFEVIPAVDVRDGQAVQLVDRGDHLEPGEHGVGRGRRGLNPPESVPAFGHAL